MSTIAVVIPTSRPESYEKFLSAWDKQFEEHNVLIIKVVDGEKQRIEVYSPYNHNTPIETYVPEEILERNIDLVPHFTPACRNLGFAAIAKFYPRIEYIVTLDDDLEPFGDTIGDHIDALNQEVPISWMSTIEAYDDTEYPRGFPYKLRKEAPVMLSHGVWENIADWDAPNQLVLGTDRVVIFRRSAIPRGVYFPFCGMNVGFRREALPYLYYAPVATFPSCERFDDIWCGIHMKRAFDESGWAVVTGYASCVHTRASNVFKNLQKEALGIELNETLWQKNPDGYEWFDEYDEKRSRWQRMILTWL